MRVCESKWHAAVQVHIGSCSKCKLFRLLNTNYIQQLKNNRSPKQKQRAVMSACLKQLHGNASKKPHIRWVSHLNEHGKLTMDSQTSTSGHGSGDNGDRTPVHVVEDCDIGLEWKPRLKGFDVLQKISSQ